MNRSQTRRAARLYVLAVIAWMDEGGADTEEEVAVVSAAIDRARDELERAAPGAPPLSSLRDIVAYVKAEARR